MTLFMLLTVGLLGTFAVAWRHAISPGPRRETTSVPSSDVDDRASWHGAGTRPDFPILALLEGGMACQPGTLTQAVDAARLEQRASLLVSEYMSENSLLTGLIPRRVFDRILAELLLGQAIPSGPIAITELTVVQTAEMPIVPAA